MRMFTIIALYMLPSLTFLTVGAPAKAKYEVFVASLSQLNDGNLISCVDIFAAISPADAPAFRDRMKVDGGIPHNHYISAGSCAELYPKTAYSEQCIYSMNPDNATKITYKFQYYASLGVTVKRNCMKIGGHYFRTVTKK